MRILLTCLFLFPFALLAQNTNYNATASGRVRLEGRSAFAPSFEIFVDSFTTLEQGSYGGNSSVFNNVTHVWHLEEASGTRVDVVSAQNYSETGGTVSSGTGKHGNAVDFNTAGRWLVSPVGHNFGNESPPVMWLGMWVYIRSLPASGKVCYLHLDSNDNNYIYIDSSGNVTFNDSIFDDADITQPLGALNTWHFIVAGDNTGTGNEVLSVDGAALSTSTSGPLGGFPDGDSLLGTVAVSPVNGSPSAPLVPDGLIDEVIMGTSDLTQSIVNSLWNGGAGVFYGGTPPDLMTLTYLTNSTISVGQFGWAYIPVSGGNTTFKRTYVGSNTFALPKATIAMGPSQYTTAGSRSASYDSNTNAVNEAAEFILPGGSGGNKTVVSFGMMIQFCATNSSATLITNRFVTLNGPPYGALQQEVSATIDEVRAYATDNGGLVAVGGAIPIVPCKLYWLTGVRNVTDGHANFSLYDPVNGAFIGESVAVMGTTNVTWNVQIGPQTAELATSGNTYWDNFIVNYHDGFYPLGPLKTTPPAPVQNVVQRRIFGQGGEEILGQGGETILGQ